MIIAEKDPPRSALCHGPHKSDRRRAMAVGPPTAARHCVAVGSTSEVTATVSEVRPKSDMHSFVLPFDRAAHGRLLVSRRHTGGCNRTHGLDKLSGRPRVGRSCAALVEPAAILELAVGIVTEEVRRADRPVCPSHCLGFVVKVWKREIMSLGEALHILK